MADKKITDLQLVDALTDGAMFPIDTGTATFRATMSQMRTYLQNLLVPPGATMEFAGDTIPTGWLLCYGQAVSRATYADLFTALGTKYGAGDGSTTFNLPDRRGRVAVGKDDMGGSAANRVTSGVSGIAGTTNGAVGGSQSHTLTQSEMPAHTHTQDAHTHNIAGYDNGTPQGGGNSGILTGNFMSYAGTGNTNRFVNSLTTATNQNTGGGGAHNNMPPSMVQNIIIKI